jgi:glycosyltransferase involved in cell wall biosynthesis
MKITFVLPGRSFSGGIRAPLRMALEMKQRGHDVKVLYRKRPLNARSVARALYRKFIIRVPQDWLGQFDGDCTSFKNLTVEVVGQRDVVVAIGPDCVEDIMKLPGKCGCKVFSARGLTLRNPELRRIAWTADIPKIAVSNYVRQEMLKAGAKDVCAVVSNGIDTNDYYPDESDSDRKAVGSIYGDGVAKDPETIISVFTELYEQRPEIPLVCFSSVRRPKELVRAVQFKRLPTVAEARRFYSKCAVWFCASRSEGYPAPVLEAMACGCAMVCTDCGGPNDYLVSGVNGIVVEKEKPDKMVQEILKLMDNEGKRTQIVNNAMKTVRSLSWSSAAAQMEAALEGIVSGRFTM